jgi:transposase
MKKEKRKFKKEFKAEAVKMVLAGDRSMTEIADSLGIEVWHLSSWKKEYLATTGSKGAQAEEDRRIRDLEKEIADLKMENAILKKATGIFSRQK